MCLNRMPNIGCDTAGIDVRQVSLLLKVVPPRGAIMGANNWV